MSHTAGEIRQQIGEILATVRTLERDLAERRTDARESEQRLNTELRAIKHDSRNSQQIIQARLELLQVGHSRLDQRLQTVEQNVIDLRGPVDELVTLRKRMGALGLMGLSLLAVVWALAGPLWTAVAERFGSWIFGGAK